MIRGIAHIGITVSNITEIIKELEILGMPCKSIEHKENIGMKIAFLGDNETKIELGEVVNRNNLTPLKDNTMGLHHIAIKVENIDDLYNKMKANEKYQIESELRQGMHGKVFFFRIKKHDSILFECES